MIKNYKIHILFFFILILVVLFAITHKSLIIKYIPVGLPKKKQNPLETMDDKSYYQHFSKLDRDLRKCGTSAQECRQHYVQSVLEFTPEEKKMLDIINKDYLKLIDGNYSRVFKKLGPLQFMKVKNDIENGMPHTRGEYIVFSKSYFQKLSNLFRRNPHFLLDRENLHVVRLIAHERFHIFQRLYPKIMEEFYQNKWKFEPLMERLPSEILEVNRTNPDALPDKNWIFHIKDNNYILPLCVYKSKHSDNINQTKNIYVEVTKNKDKVRFSNLKLDLTEKKLLINLKEFSEFFGYQGANNYHPHEISASLFEDAISATIDKTQYNENETSNLHKNSEAFSLLVDFFSNLN